MFDFCHSILDKQPWILVKDWKIFVGVVALKMYSSQKSEAASTVWMGMIILIIVADGKLYRKPLFWMQMLFERYCRYIMTACVPGTVTVMRNRAGFYGFCGKRLRAQTDTSNDYWHTSNQEKNSSCVWERETDRQCILKSSQKVYRKETQRQPERKRGRQSDSETDVTVRVNRYTTYV